MTNFTSSYTAAAIPLAERGDTVVSIAEAFGVATRSVYNWMRSHPEFKEAIARGRAKRPPAATWNAGVRTAAHDRGLALELLRLIHKSTSNPSRSPPITEANDKIVGVADAGDVADQDERHRRRDRPPQRPEREASQSYCEEACAPIPMDDPLAGW